MDNQKCLILIDGHALAFREYYALERTGMKTSNGTQTWAVYGFFKAIFDLLKNKKIKPDSIAVAFDVGRQTFRVEKFQDYKANREAMPDSLRSQLGLIVEGLQAFNIPIYTKEGFEADDVIGTIVTKAAKLGHKTYILTGDQDSFQLIDKDGFVKVLIPSKGELITYDWDKVHEKLGVWPNQVVDYKSLRGDTADNIPGVKGIGEKTAQKLLSNYSNLEEILENVDNIAENSVKNKLKEGVEIAKLSKYLATIIRNVDIKFDFNDTKVELPEISKVMDYLKKMQFYSFVKNIDEILCTFDKNCEQIGQQAQEQMSLLSSENNTSQKEQTIQAPQNGQMQLGLFATAVKEAVETESYEKLIIENETELEKLIENIKSKGIVSCFFVSDFTNAADVQTQGGAFGLQGDRLNTYYVDNKGENFNKLKQILEDNNIKKYVYNAKNDINILKNLGINLTNIDFDVYLASYIKNPNRNHDLSAQAFDYINHISTELEDKKSKLSSMSKSVLADYAMDNAFSIFKLAEFWKNELTSNEIKLHDEIELPLSLVLAQMEFDGVSIDIGYMRELSNYMAKNMAELETKIFNISGQPFNINSPKQVGDILYNKLNIQLKKKRGKATLSTNVEVLEKLAEEHEICRLLIEYRKYSKLKSTYTDALPLIVSPKDSKIHTTYNQAATSTGRLSSSNPNLQNIPIRTEEGNKLRKAFVPKSKGNFILSSDYSQIELRLLAHISNDKNLIDAFNSGIDIHSLTASKVFGVTVENVTKEMRYKAKAVNFGIIYGQTKYGLAKALKITAQEAEMFINKYFETYPNVKIYMTSTVENAYKNGYVETMFGRRRYLESELSSPNRMVKEFAERAAINHPIQGTAADLIKIAMINTDKKFAELNLKSKMVMQVHDELVFEVEKNELEKVKEIVSYEMQNAVKMKVPLPVDMNWGESWKES